jgi:hypothetical protein
MQSKLKEHLAIEWKQTNHRKYHKYFDEWYINLTKDQIHHFTLQMNNKNIYVQGNSK